MIGQPLFQQLSGTAIMFHSFQLDSTFAAMDHSINNQPGNRKGLRKQYNENICNQDRTLAINPVPLWPVFFHQKEMNKLRVLQKNGTISMPTQRRIKQKSCCGLTKIMTPKNTKFDFSYLSIINKHPVCHC